jgi:hypothetical protein
LTVRNLGLKPRKGANGGRLRSANGGAIRRFALEDGDFASIKINGPANTCFA